jgi:hypothetical protein
MKQADNEHVPQRSGVFRARKNGTLTFKRGPAAQPKSAKAPVLR